MSKPSPIIKRPNKKVESEASILMWTHLQELQWNNLNPCIVAREVKFCDDRKWRFDFTVVGDRKLAIEIDGGMWIQGRHTRGSGQVKDNEKFNEAARLGWRILKFTPAEVLDGRAIAFIKRVLES